MSFPITRLLLLGISAALFAPASEAICAAPAVLQEPSEPAQRDGLYGAMPTLPEAVRIAILDGRFAEALTSIQAFQDARDGARDFWLYLEGVVRARMGEHDAAITAFAAVLGEFPDGPWAHKARFRTAESMRATGRWQDAERIYEEEVQRLRGDARQGELADVYLGFADELSTASPTNPDPQATDLDRAVLLYRKVLDLQPPQDKREHALYRIAQCLADKQSWGEAAAAWRAYVASQDPLAGAVAGDERVDDAPLRVYEAQRELAAALRNGGDLRGARRAFEDLAARLAARLDGGPEFAEADRVSADALRGDALYGVARCFDDSSRDRAIGALRRYLEGAPEGHRYLADARFGVGDLLQDEGRFDEALAAFAEFLATPPTTGPADEDIERAARLRVRADFLVAEIHMQRGDHAAAGLAYASYVARHPAGADWAAAQEGIVYADYARGQELLEAGEWQAAREAWTDFLERRPLDPDAREIFYMIGDLHREQADEMDEGAPERAEAYRAAIAHWARLVAKYPGSEEASEALYQSGWLQETELGDLDEAVATYRRCDFGGYAGASRARLQLMLEDSLSVVTERTWRADEPARLKVYARNLETLRVQVYPLDLESYFRKHLSYQSVEDLDLDLITPARSFEITLDGYRRWKPLTQDIEIPVDGPGTWAVAVSAGDLRATTLVVRSDIDVLVKSSRHDMLLWAEDMRAVKVAAGTRFLVAFPGAGEGGAPRIEQVVAGADGVAMLDLDALGIEGVDDVRVFADRGGHVAATHLGLWGLGATQGARPRAFLYAERSMYRPGDEVRWRGVVRDAAEGSYVVSPGERYLVTITDPETRVVARERMDLSEFGTLHGVLHLDEAAPVGSYGILLEAPDGKSFAGSFQVARFQLPKVGVELTFDREVYYRGETVVGTVSAAWYYGEPVADAPLQVQTPEGRVLELRTDAEGKAEFRFDTRRLDNDGRLGFAATLPEEGVSTQAGVLLSSTGFQATVTVARGVVLAGAALPVSVRTMAPDGAPLARDLRLEAVLQEDDGRGSWSERVVATRELRTDETSGRAELSLALDEGGTYTLRVSGEDRFANPVIATASVFVSGEGDEVLLHLLADSDAAKVGETLAINLHNRAGEGLSLVTFEGEGVLGYRIVELKSGSNPLEFAVDHQHFPNFVVSASLMHGTELYSASAPFRVSRELQVRVIPSAEEYRPGSEAEVRIEVTDQLGRPVRAELSLAAVDAALFARFPDQYGNLRGAFENGLQRNAELRTSSSISFSYSGETVEVEEAVLEEMELELAANAWESRRREALDQLRDKAGRRPPGAPAAEPMAGAGLALARSGMAPAQLGELGYVLDASEDFEGYFGPSDVIGMGGGAGGRFGGRGGRAGLHREVEGVDAAAAYWNPSVVTDADGIATLRFPLPERSTRWRLMARGVGEGTTLGQTAAYVITKAAFFVEMRAPAQLTAGDRPQVLARVHNATGLSGAVRLELALESGGRRLVGVATVEVDGDGVFEQLVSLPDGLDPADAAQAKLSLTAAPEFADDLDYAVERTIPVAPWGIERFDSEGGMLAASRTVELALPDGDYRDLMLELQFGGGLDQLLVDEVLGRAPRPWRSGGSAPTAVGAASELIGACAVLHYLEQGGNADAADYAALRERAAALVATLVARQRGDGSWSWIGGQRESQNREQASPEATARAMSALAQARARGMLVPPRTLEAGIAAMRAAQQAAGTTDDELKAQLLYALTLSDAGDFAVANRLHRVRGSLGTAALAYTALALQELGSAGMAAELAQELEQRWQADAGFALAGNQCWNMSPVETDALALLALQAALPSSPRIPEGIDHLLALRPWPRDSAGMAAAAVAVWRGTTSRQDEAVEITVQVGDGQAQVVRVGPGARSVELATPLAAGARSVRVRLDKRGRGDVHFLAVLRGFSRALVPGGNPELEVRTQQYLAPHPRYRGATLYGGFSTVHDLENWNNEVGSVGLGETARMALRVVRRVRNTVREQDRDYMVLEVPIPAGVQVLEDSVSGDFLSWRLDGDRLVFHLDRRVTFGDYSFEVLGTVPGDYRVLPPMLRDAYRRAPASYGAATDFRVRVRGEASSDGYRATPDELFQVGRAMYRAGDHEGAWQRLTALHDEFGNWLRDDVLRDAADMLLVLAVEQGQPNRIVAYFEVLKEKYPELTVPFDRMLRVGEAYRELAEHERAYLIFRAIVEETYGKDLKLAGVLEEQGDFHAAIETLLRLWTEYPDSPAVVETHLTLADMLLSKAPEAYADASLRAAGVDRALLTTDGIFLLQRFLALYADEPLAADAALNLVSAYLDLEDYTTAAKLSEEMAGRFRAPRYADAFQYTRAVASWYLGEDDVAVGLLQGIAGAIYTDEQGREARSENRDLALYILGQIYHARQEFGTAAEYYEQVAQVFSDAREVLAGFRARDVRLAEVSASRPGEPVQVELSFRNVEQAELLVYAVDLMTLYLREKNLTGITSVNLAGIAPIEERSVTLRPDGSMREQTVKVGLDLVDPGAYLVICRSGALHTSGLVLVSDLELEVGEDPVSGRLRVQALDQSNGRYVRDVDVRVIGSDNPSFTSGRTDPRGMFIADEVLGRSTVIARHDDRHFAFFRGEQVLGAPVQRGRNAERQQLLDSDDFFDNVRSLNSLQQQDRKRAYKEELEKGREGVQVKQVK